MVDLYMKIDGIAGLSKSMPGYIDLAAFSWGVSNPTMRGQGSYGQYAMGKASFQDFSITKCVDPLSPLIVRNMFTGQHIKTAEVICRRTGTEGGVPQEYFKVVFGDLTVSSHNFGGGQGDSMMMETITFRFKKINYTSAALKEGVDQGAVNAGWDLKQNVEG
jgi:type VI secretion system secreted protein Hcp